LGLLGISYALYTVASSSLLNVHSPAVYNSPVPQMLFGQAALGQLGVWLMLIATLLTAVMTFNGGFATASRFLYAAAREDTLPPIFSRISQKQHNFFLNYSQTLPPAALSSRSRMARPRP
jgi:APA family basic amino acid/polyamine antiporter